MDTAESAKVSHIMVWDTIVFFCSREILGVLEVKVWLILSLTI